MFFLVRLKSPNIEIVGLFSTPHKLEVESLLSTIRLTKELASLASYCIGMKLAGSDGGGTNGYENAC
jgi:hypothetical protein